MYLDKYDIIFYSFGLLLIATFLFLSSAHAETTSTYYNQYGNTVVGNEYHQDGTVTSTYYNQYGDTTVGNTYDNQASSNDTK